MLHDLISQALREHKRVLLPVVVGNELELRCLTATDQLHLGAFHILEPLGLPFTDYDTIDLAIIPGVAFTSSGQRLGRGRGYYDRLLPHLNTYTIGLAWPFQIIDALPLEPHDINLDEVLTSS